MTPTQNHSEPATFMDSAYRAELVQVAAVAIAMIECHDQGAADLTLLPDIIDELVTERAAQNQKWGAQAHGPATWLAILMEEVGEAAQAYLERNQTY